MKDECQRRRCTMCGLQRVGARRDHNAWPLGAVLGHTNLARPSPDLCSLSLFTATCAGTDLALVPVYALTCTARASASMVPASHELNAACAGRCDITTMHALV